MFNKIDVSMYREYMSLYPNGKTIFESLSETLSSYNNTVDEVNKILTDINHDINTAEETIRLESTETIEVLKTDINSQFSELEETNNTNNSLFQDSVLQQLTNLTNSALSNNLGWFKDEKTGIILQWGNGSSSIAGNSLNFPIVFPNNCFAVIAGNVGSTPGIVTVESKDLDKFFTKGSVETWCYWFAIGN